MKYISLILVLFCSSNTFAQLRNWTEEYSKDGKSTVKYEIVKEEKGKHFYYIAQTYASTTLDELDAYFSNTENHKNFLESTPITQEIEKISDNEWIAYYYFDAPWPMADSDLVLKINRVKADDTLVFIATAISHDYTYSDVERMTDYKVVYEFEKINDSTTKITYNANYIPLGSIPNFLINTWFPEGPAKIVTSLGAKR
ncbi:MAG: hypothetical protein BM564_01145 [Bacteroidetes bacterium MedPE-SWsnd-G2]|nr:MAG: hypothetical protein BM564_01145 [Bacteroidetes bacterium MedPE-SWsnd-G2]